MAGLRSAQRRVLPGQRGVVCVAFCSLLAGCGGGSNSPDLAIEQITRYVDSQHIQQVQRTRITELSDGRTAELFLIEYGPGDDCPAGCIYNRFFGLRDGNKVGKLVSAENSNAGNFDFDASDTRLYTDKAFDMIRAVPYDRDFVYTAYLNAVGADPDVPAEALIRVAHRLQFETTGRALLSNPTVRQNRDVLTILANLPEPAGYDFSAIKAQAQTLLNGLSAKSVKKSKPIVASTGALRVVR